MEDRNNAAAFIREYIYHNYEGVENYCNFIAPVNVIETCVGSPVSCIFIKFHFPYPYVFNKDKIIFVKEFI